MPINRPRCSRRVRCCHNINQLAIVALQRQTPAEFRQARASVSPVRTENRPAPAGGELSPAPVNESRGNIQLKRIAGGIIGQRRRLNPGVSAIFCKGSAEATRDDRAVVASSWRRCCCICCSRGLIRFYRFRPVAIKVRGLASGPHPSAALNADGRGTRYWCSTAAPAPAASGEKRRAPAPASARLPAIQRKGP